MFRQIRFGKRHLRNVLIVRVPKVRVFQLERRHVEWTNKRGKLEVFHSSGLSFCKHVSQLFLKRIRCHKSSASRFANLKYT